MVRPAAFGFNEQTASDNAFQKNNSSADLRQKAQQEFDRMVATLRGAGIEVLVVDDTAEPVKPDAIFPNNWFCTMPGGTVAIFPMYASNRRLERRKDIIDRLMHEYKVTELEDWSAHEQHHLYLEGTGSMVIDHVNRIIYGCTSERTNPVLLHQFAQRTGYEAISFSAKDWDGVPVYHTNVMMCLGNGFCVACIDMIDKDDRDMFIDSLNKTNRKLVPISPEQVNQFAGNMLQLQNKAGDHLLVMSQRAFDALDSEQLSQLREHTALLPVDIPTIETVGGGSARCMMAELFLLPDQQ